MASTFHIQAHDIKMLATLGEWGIADTEILWHRFYPNDKSGNYCRHRLGRIRDENFLQSFATSVNCRRHTKRRTKNLPCKLPTVWQLTPAGADFVQVQTGHRPVRPASSASLSAMTLAHRLGVVKHVRLPIDCAHATLGIAERRWFMEQDQYRDRVIQLTDPPHKRFLLYEAWGTGPTRIICRPDASVLLAIPGRPGQPSWSLTAYIEYDRSTETTQQVAAKCAGYATLLNPKTKYFRRHWPPAFDPKLDRDFGRVLFVCRSPERQQNIRRAIAKLPGAEYWRFAVERHLRLTPWALTKRVWKDVHGERMALLPVSYAKACAATAVAASFDPCPHGQGPSEIDP